MSEYYVIRSNQLSYGTLEVAEKEALSRAKASCVAYAVVKQVSIATPVQISAKIERVKE
jgi:hypothetical protein